jgi:hypothetical protein
MVFYGIILVSVVERVNTCNRIRRNGGTGGRALARLEVGVRPVEEN